MAQHRRSQKQGMPLFSAESGTSGRIIRRVSMEDAERYEKAGVWERRYDGNSGELLGFQMVACYIYDQKVPASKPSPAAISASEMEVFAGVAGRSRTARLSELDKLQRIHDGLPSEDHIERTMCKVFVFPHVGAAKGDILRAWPK
jgi:hypothetical protein